MFLFLQDVKKEAIIEPSNGKEDDIRRRRFGMYTVGEKVVHPMHGAGVITEITEERMRELAQPMLKNQYGQYLLKVIEELKETGDPNLG